MQNNLILSPILLEDLIKAITASVIESIRADQRDQEIEKLLSTKEVADLFKVTTVSISNWIAKGKLQPYIMGGRNYFKYSEVMDSLKTLKKYKA